MTRYNILGGVLSYGIDEIKETHIVYPEPVRYRVLNFTHHYFSIGVTSSGGVGVWISKAAKRGGSAVGVGTHTVFKGLLFQIGVHWAKIYLYFYFKGDGLK